MGQPGDVAVGGIALLAAGEGDYPEFRQVFAHLRAPREFFEQFGVSPRGVNRHLWRENVCVALEAHLVVAASRRAMHEGGDAPFFHLADELFDRNGTADSG